MQNNLTYEEKAASIPTSFLISILGFEAEALPKQFQKIMGMNERLNDEQSRAII